MAKYLVIVESPAKVKTIKKFLGSAYTVDASGGHVRDLPKSQLGFDPEHDYEPKYITIRGKGETLAKLRKEVKKADTIYLATDPDREGEAISWHLMKALKLDETQDKKVYRISFNEITKNAVKASLKSPRALDINLVNAQQTRRMLDRMVGYRISPLLWSKVKRGLSAGRVQSVALRIICDREEEINAFIPEEYWTLDAVLLHDSTKSPITAHYYGITGENAGKAVIHSKEEMDAILSEIEHSPYRVCEIKSGERTKKPPIPFTTSTLQQEASKNLNLSTQATMRLAQQLYEGVDIEGRGSVALITYLRTDSTRVAEEADTAVRTFIRETIGIAYEAGAEPAKKNGTKKIQDAHEAIRPTDVTLIPEEVKESLSRDQFRLYRLIWRRFVASRMAPAIYKTTSMKVAAGRHLFSASASRLSFDGFLKVYTDPEDKEEKGRLFGQILPDDILTVKELTPQQHFTQHPPHFTEASLVKTLEEQGIGRPSTYAPTITTILARHYCTKENKNLYVTELGEVVNRIMKSEFPSIVDVTFTANLETLLDKIADGTVPWKTVVSNFYPDLDEAVINAEKHLESVKIADELSDEFCEQCGRQMVIKYGPHGKFLACPGFPDCRNTKPYLQKIGIPCPLCGKDVVIRKTRKGRVYYGCTSGADCEFISWQRPVTNKCPQCGSWMMKKGNKILCSKKECSYQMDEPKE